MSRVPAVNSCVLILGVTLYIGLLNQTFLARNRRRIKKDGNFFLYCYACWPKKNFFSEISHFLHVWRKHCISADIPGSSIPLPFFPNVNYCFEEDKDGKADISCHGVGNFAIQIISLWRDPPYGLSNSNTDIS